MLDFAKGVQGHAFASVVKFYEAEAKGWVLPTDISSRFFFAA
jgi:hypothetical protein